MKKYPGYDKTEAFTGDYETLEVGGHVCKILKLTAENKDYGQLLRIGFDIAEGDRKGYYRRRFASKIESFPDAKWPGMYYQTIKETDLKYFKGFITVIELSNPGYKWDWDESKLVGKMFGGIFGEEEYINNDGKLKTSVKCRYTCSVDKIKEGVKIPDIKKLQGNGNTSSYVPDNEDTSFFQAPEEDDLPF